MIREKKDFYKLVLRCEPSHCTLTQFHHSTFINEKFRVYAVCIFYTIDVSSRFLLSNLLHV
jgi:hypothetical protein